MLSLFYAGKGFSLFFCFSAVGHGFSLLIIEEEGRGGKEDGRGRKRKARLALRLGRRALGTAIREGGARRKEERMDEMLSVLLP